MIFARIADFVVKRHKAILVFWLVAFIVAIGANQVWKLEDITSYSISGFIPTDTESAEADRIVSDQFPSGSTAASSIAIVIVAPDATSGDVRNFTVDLDEMIYASQYIGSPYPFIPFNLTGGGMVLLTNQIKYLMDPSQATIYGIYRGMAFSLAQNMTGPLHANVTATQGILGMYYGIPLYYVNTWMYVPGDNLSKNSAAYNATFANITSSFPPTELPLALGYFQSFAGFWNTSFLYPANSTLTPIQRGDLTITYALPAFLSQAPLPPEAKAMQLNFTQTFNMANFASLPLIENYTFNVIATFVPTASPSFYHEVYSSLPANASFEQALEFARTFVRMHSLSEMQSLLILPYDPASYFFSPNRTIMLMNYEFSKADDYEEPDGTRPLDKDVELVRTIIDQLKTQTELRTHTALAFNVYVTGSAALNLDQGVIFSGGEEFIVTMVLVVILIGLYFRSIVSPAFPLATIGVAIFIANLFIFFLGTHFFTIDFATPAVLETILLAAGTDYSIFLISRYRDERLDGKTREEAVRQSVTWAGESIATSGGAVLLSFAALGLASFPIVRTMGISIGFAISLAIILSITLIPSILLLLGNRVFWPHNIKMSKLRKQKKQVKSLSRKYFAASARFSMKHAKAIVLVALLISVPATYFVITEEASYDFSKGMPPTESSQGLDAMSAAFGASYFYKSYVVVRLADRIILQDGNLSIDKMYALENLTVGVQQGNPGIKSTEGPVNPEGTILPYKNWTVMTPEQRMQLIQAVKPYVGIDNRTVRIFVVLQASVFSGDAVAAISQLKDDVARLRGTEPILRSSSMYVGGATAVIRDVADSTNQDLKIMAIVVALGLFIILMIVLGSILIPLRAILTILLSITWTLATTILLFQFWKGIDMIFVMPLIVFVLAMGLGMDYDIFIITRVREEVAKGKTDKQAILTSISRTGGIISACGIVMAGAFFSLMLKPLPLLQEMGFALAFVVLIDSMIVRIYLVPAIMVLAGKYNWWAPKFLQRVKRPANAERDSSEENAEKDDGK